MTVAVVKGAGACLSNPTPCSHPGLGSFNALRECELNSLRGPCATQGNDQGLKAHDMPGGIAGYMFTGYPWPTSSEASVWPNSGLRSSMVLSMMMGRIMERSK